MIAARKARPRDAVEIRAVMRVVEALCKEALEAALRTSREQRGIEMVALHATIPHRLVEEGIALERARELAHGIRVTVEVAADDN